MELVTFFFIDFFFFSPFKYTTSLVAHYTDTEVSFWRASDKEDFTTDNRTTNGRASVIVRSLVSRHPDKWPWGRAVTASSCPPSCDVRCVPLPSRIPSTKFPRVFLIEAIRYILYLLHPIHKINTQVIVSSSDHSTN